MKDFPTRHVAAIALVAAALAFLGWYALESGGGAGAARAAELPAPGYPMEVARPDGTRMTLPGPPQRILPANSGVLEFLFALVEPERVVAVPAAAVSYSALPRASRAWRDRPFFPSYTAESILALEPDLVLSHAWQSPETTARILDAGIPAVSSPLPHTWEEVLDTLRFLGRVLGEDERARDVERDLQTRIAALRRSPHFDAGIRALSYSNLGTGGTTAGTGTTIDIVLGLAGIENAAAAAGLSGHASIDHERLLSLEPTVILVATDEGDTGVPPSVSYLTGTPALATLDAIEHHRIAFLPIELFTTTSLELVRAAEQLQAELDRVLE